MEQTSTTRDTHLYIKYHITHHGGKEEERHRKKDNRIARSGTFICLVFCLLPMINAESEYQIPPACMPAASHGRGDK